MDWEKLLVEAFKNDARVKIIKVLSTGKKNISRIVRETGKPYVTVERNLEGLKEAGIVRESRLGRVRIYELKDDELVRKILGCIFGVVEEIR